MSRTLSTMMPLGTQLPDFELAAPDGSIWATTSADQAPGLLVMFLCNHCPSVVHVGRELGLLTQRWSARGLGIVGLNSNDPGAYPADAPEKMAPLARSFGWDFPYLVDEDAEVATAFRAACTPDFFLFGSESSLVYRGRFDASRPGNGTPVTGGDLRAAVNAVFDSHPPPAEQLPSMGCNIKWPPGRDPEVVG